MLKTDLNNFDNRWYKPGSRFKIFLWLIFNRLFFNSGIPYPIFLKLALLRLFGAKIGKGIVLKPYVNIKYPWFLEIQDSVWIGENTWIDNLASVKIGPNACVSQGAYLLTGNHDYTTSSFDLLIREITLEEGVWIGAQAVVCPGVTCKSHSILTVGSIATRDLEEYMIYQGNPAKPIRKREIVK